MVKSRSVNRKLRKRKNKMRSEDISSHCHVDKKPVVMMTSLLFNPVQDNNSMTIDPHSSRYNDEAVNLAIIAGP